MTYSGLKSLIYAGLTRDDPRVKTAVNSIRRNSIAPSLLESGTAFLPCEEPFRPSTRTPASASALYYDYQTFAKAMALLGDARPVDADAKPHDWRADLFAALAKRQAPSGSWVNRPDSFMEGDPNTGTSYALLALAAARPKT